MTDKKKKWLWFCLVVLPLICSRSADAISKKNVIRILVKQNKLYHFYIKQIKKIVGGRP